MPSDTKTRTILLADLVGSTTKMTRMEIEQGTSFIQDATEPIRDAVKQHDGRLVKFTGDGYIATFESADDALEAADAIRSHFLHQKYTPAGILMDGVRIVLNTADVVVKDGDLIGDGVIVAARLEKNVPTNAIWLTSATREVCSNTIFGFEDIGTIHIRGRSRPVHVYALQGNDATFVEQNITLLITEMHHYIKSSEALDPSQVNEWLMAWNDLHRQAVQSLKGRVRQFVADMSLLTFEKPDDAYHAWLNLKALVTIHNKKSKNSLPPYIFKGGMCYGNLILSPTGVVGPLVNRTFDVLNGTPRQSFGMSAKAYEELQEYKQDFVEQKLSDNSVIYVAHAKKSQD